QGWKVPEESARHPGEAEIRPAQRPGGVLRRDGGNARRPILKAFLRAAPAALCVFLASCGTVFFGDDEPVVSGGDRRVYVNDKAANDSLPRDVVVSGVKFVL